MQHHTELFRARRSDRASGKVKDGLFCVEVADLRTQLQVIAPGHRRHQKVTGTSAARPTTRWKANHSTSKVNHLHSWDIFAAHATILKKIRSPIQH
jgi:hypothetical protein